MVDHICDQHRDKWGACRRCGPFEGRTAKVEPSVSTKAATERAMPADRSAFDATSELDRLAVRGDAVLRHEIGKALQRAYDAGRADSLTSEAVAEMVGQAAAKARTDGIEASAKVCDADSWSPPRCGELIRALLAAKEGG